MPRAKKTDEAAPETPPAPPEPMRSEEVMVIPPAEDEPVRMGGYLLTDKGWVLDRDLPAVPDTSEGDTPVPTPAPEQE